MPNDPNNQLAPPTPPPTGRSLLREGWRKAGQASEFLLDEFGRRMTNNAFPVIGSLSGSWENIKRAAGQAIENPDAPIYPEALIPEVFRDYPDPQPNAAVEGQRKALRQQTDPNTPPPPPTTTTAAPPTTPAVPSRADMGVAADGIPNALRAPDTGGIDASQASAALSRGLQRRAYLNQQSPAAGLEGEELRKAAGYRDMTAEVDNFVGPRETRYFKGQAYTPAMGGGGVSTFETPDSVREQMVRDAEETRLARAIEDPDNLGTLQRRTDIERSSLEQLESHRAALAKQLESHRSGLIQERGADTVEQAMAYLDQIEAQEMKLFRKDPRYQQLTPAQIEYAEMKLRADQMHARAQLRLVALGGPGGIAQYIENQGRLPGS